MKRTLMLVAPLALAACQTIGPTWSELSGDHYYNTAVMYRRPAIIERVDDKGSFPQYPIKVEPGRHVIEVKGPAPKWPGGGELKNITIDMEPCKRYFVVAQFNNNVDKDYTPVIDYVEPIAGCRVG